jgi:glycine/D-amino acid oxidase-like deaminating enzyme
VLGAGIQGVCVALALHRRGWAVTLVDRAARPLTGASVHGEGKLHLGLVYANEPSRRTASLMLDGAMSFSALIDGWLPRPVDWARARSEPFWYAVPEDTMVPVDRLADHYQWVAGEARARVRAGDPYAGCAPERWVESAVLPTGCVDVPLAGSFRTAEVALDPLVLRPALIDGLGDLGVTWLGEHLVHGVERTTSGFRVDLEHGGPVALDADLVVNCLWDGRLLVDATIDLVPERPWVFRLKQYVEGRLPDTCPSPGSITLALGPYGDTVQRRDGRLYGSWYPDCLAGWSDELAPPAEWRPLMDGTLDPEDLAAHAERITTAFARVVPAMGQLDVERCGAGVIFAWGNRDIDDRASELHQRADIGVSFHEGYATIDTGKLTTAPLFARQLLETL